MEELIVPYLNNVALVLLLCILIGGVYLVIYIHDIPYEIAKKRNHPHQDAFHAAGWVSLFLMHTIWPILWVWAFWYKEDAPERIVVESSASLDEITALKEENEMLKKQLEQNSEINQKES